MMVSFATGCSSGSRIVLTDSEEAAIAQYSAYLVLKYDRRHNMQDRLLSAKEYKVMTAPEVVKEEPKPLPTATPKPTRTPKKSTPTPTPKPTAEPTVKPTAVPRPTEPPVKQDDTPYEQGDIYVGIINGNRASSIADCFGTESLDMSYISYVQAKTYRSTSQYFAISAPEGKELLIVRIAITNLTSRDLRFRSDDYPVRYQLIMTGHKAVEPRLSLFTNDIQLMDETIGAGHTQEAVLLFYIDSDATQATLRILGDYSDGTAGKAYDISLK